MAGMKMQVLFLVICFAAVARCCRADDGSWTNDASQKASEAMDDASDTAGSWTDWAYSKFSEGARKLSESEASGETKVQDTLQAAKESVTDAYQTADIKDSFEHAKDTVASKAQDTYQAAKDTVSPSPTPSDGN